MHRSAIVESCLTGLPTLMEALASFGLDWELTTTGLTVGGTKSRTGSGTQHPISSGQAHNRRGAGYGTDVLSGLM